jgi:hypothetical protein
MKLRFSRCWAIDVARSQAARYLVAAARLLWLPARTVAEPRQASGASVQRRRSPAVAAADRLHALAGCR